MTYKYLLNKELVYEGANNIVNPRMVLFAISKRYNVKKEEIEVI